VKEQTRHFFLFYFQTGTNPTRLSEINLLVVSHFVKLGACQIHFPGRICQLGVLNKDPTVWLDGARQSPLVLLVLPSPENEFGEVII
jgi:hypothetical protein